MDSRPLVRWWWLSGPFTEPDIERQLEWVRDHGFGGVELAWLNPSWLEKEDDDRLRPAWLGDEWSRLVAFTKQQATRFGLRCDFTFGSSWPFGGSCVQAADASQTFVGLSRQRLRGTWEEPEAGEVFIVNHLSRVALSRYAEQLVLALQGALSGPRSALFCDSLELDTEDIWSPELWDRFEQRFGYALHPYSDAIDHDIQVRYDYRKFIGETIQGEFYQAFTELCHASGADSRVQCHGAPADLLSTYAAVDIPESEALLFPPAFSRIAASAAAWAGKEIVSAEAFTCIYGFPGVDDSAEEFWKREEIGDMKLLADALFANGINQIVWHGMPYQPFGKEVEFYASVHVGPDSRFEPQLWQFNRYLEQVSGYLREGQPYGQVGVYLPWEDALLLDALPSEVRTPGANYFWEMRHAAPPAGLSGCNPVWVSYPFLREAEVKDGGGICSRKLTVQAIYVDCEWLDYESLRELARLAKQGARLVWKRLTREPGKVKNADYSIMLGKIREAAISNLDAFTLISGEDLPWYWARRLDGDLLLFVAHPAVKALRYPMPHRYCLTAGEIERTALLNWSSREISLDLKFEAQQSLLLLVSGNGAVKSITLERL